MKKIIIPIIIVLIVLTIIIVVVTHSNNLKQQEENIKNIKATTETFTITDIGTEIDVKLKNENNEQIDINGIEATLYDSSDKEITTIIYDEKINIKKEKIIKIVSDEKYSSTANIKYKIII